MIADERVNNFSFPNNHFRLRDGLAGWWKTFFESITGISSIFLEIRLRISLIAEVCVNDILLCNNDFGLRNREI